MSVNLDYEAFKKFIAKRDDDEVINNRDGWAHCAVGLFAHTMIHDAAEWLEDTYPITPILEENGFPHDVAMDLGNCRCVTMLDVNNLIAKHETLTVTY